MYKGNAESYKVFVRTWWRLDGRGHRIPGAGRPRTIARGCTLEEARTVAQGWNATHAPGYLSRKAEFTRE